VSAVYTFDSRSFKHEGVCVVDMHCEYTFICTYMQEVHSNIKGLVSKRADGSKLRIGIVRARWNDKVVSSLTNGCIGVSWCLYVYTYVYITYICMYITKLYMYIY
jgi:hypothetical protein